MKQLGVRVAVTGLIVSIAGCSAGPHPVQGFDRPGDGAAIDSYAPQAHRIISAALAGNDGLSKLQQLCDGVGHRLSGSPELSRALTWATEVLRRDGQENVRIESVMVPHWIRGEESAEIVEPRRVPLAMLGLGGSVATPPEGIRAPVLCVRDEAELEAAGSRAAGRIVLFNNRMPPYDKEHGSGYGTAVRFRGKGASLAAKQGAVACLVRSVTARSLRSPHTGAMRYEDGVQRIPAAAISTEDADTICRMLAAAQEVVVFLRMQARSEPDAPSGNVIAELRGAERPEEVVVISGHIDSWDVGQGAHDDGAGCVISMEALNVLRRLNLRPRRTIRVVLWTNEENGLRGAKQYVADHAAELPLHVAAIEADSGCFKPRGFSLECHDEDRAAIARRQLSEFLSLMDPLKLAVHGEGSGADIGPMRDANFPLLGFQVEGSSYFDYHHSHADTLDKIDPHDLRECIAVMAATAYVIADMPQRLGHE